MRSKTIWFTKIIIHYFNIIIQRQKMCNQYYDKRESTLEMWMNLMNIERAKQ